MEHREDSTPYVEPPRRQPRQPVFRSGLRVALIILAIIVTYVSIISSTSAFLTSAISLYALISLLLVLFYDRLRLLWLYFSKPHAVICGEGHFARTCASRFAAAGYPVVLVFAAATREDKEWCRNNGYYLVSGDPSDHMVLARARAGRAACLIAASDNDGMNSGIASGVTSLAVTNPGITLPCLIHITDPRLCALLMEHPPATPPHARIRMEFFNIFHIAGVLVLQDNPFFPAGLLVPPEPHILVIGAGKMGESLIVHASRIFGDEYGDAGGRLTITLADRNADARAGDISLRYPAIRAVTHIHPVTTDLHSPGVTGSLLSPFPGLPPVTMIYVCLADEVLGLSTALEMQLHPAAAGIPVVVRTKAAEGLPTLLHLAGGAGQDSIPGIRIFPLMERTCSPDILAHTTNELLARAIHAEYYALQVRSGVREGSSPAVVPWEQLPPFFREENRRQADAIREKIAKTGRIIVPVTRWGDDREVFAPEEVEDLARNEHERWIRERAGDGWQFGSQRDDPQRLHPSMVTWENLPEAEREKDRNAVRTLPRTLSHAGLMMIHRHQVDPSASVTESTRRSGTDL